MKTRFKQYLVLSMTVSVVMLFVAAATYLSNRPSTVVSQLELAVARVPLGIPALEADAIMGIAPDEVSAARGVMMNSATMLASTNDLATNYGEPQTFTLRVWRQGGNGATVVVDADGLVAGHWAWSE